MIKNELKNQIVPYKRSLTQSYYKQSKKQGQKLNYYIRENA